MTKAYQKMSAADALYTAARMYPGSVEALAVRMGKSAHVLRSKLAPDVDTHHVTLEETLQIIELLDATKPSAADLAIRAINWRLGRVTVRHDGVDSDPTSLEVQALTACSLVGLLAADVATAMAQTAAQQITRKEADTLNKDIARALDALFTMKDSIEHRTINSKTKPRPPVVGENSSCSACSLREQGSPERRVLPDGGALRVLTTPKNRK